MAVLLFRLNNVPDDEAMDIRELLEANDIYFYETSAGRWRIGLDAIWLTDSTNEEKARELIKHYQLERTANQKKNYAQLVESGEAPTLWQNIRENPVRIVAALVAVIFILLLSLVPFAMLFHQ